MEAANIDRIFLTIMFSCITLAAATILNKSYPIVTLIFVSFLTPVILVIYINLLSVFRRDFKLRAISWVCGLSLGLALLEISAFLTFEINFSNYIAHINSYELLRLFILILLSTTVWLDIQAIKWIKNIFHESLKII